MAVVLTASACTGSATTPAPGNSGAPAGGKINLVLEHMETPQNRVDAFQVVIDGFNKSQSQYTVLQESVGWDVAYQRVIAQLQSDQVPDMVEAIPAFFTTIRASGKLPPATTVFNKLAAKHTFLDSYVQQFKWDNEVWAVPMWGMVESLYYNKALLAKAGVQPPTTWSELLAAAKTLTGNGVYGYSGPAGDQFNGLQVLYNFMLSNGSGNIYDESCAPIVDNPQTVAAFDFYHQLLAYSEPDSGSYNWAEVVNAFDSGKAAMMTFKGDPIGEWVAAGQDASNLGIIANPKPDTGTSTDLALSYSNGIMVTTADPVRQEGIYEFLDYFLQTDTYGTWLGTAQPGLFLPVTKEGETSQTFWNSPIIAQFKSQVQTELTINDTSALYGFTQKAYCPAVGTFEGDLTAAKALDKMQAGGMSPADAVKWLQAQMVTQK
jgi:multiple sugar transport system substrate-binding protein